MRRDPLLFVLAISGVGLGLASLLPGQQAQAGPPQLVQYQGRLVDSNGVPLEGTVNTLTFRLYSTAAATSADFVWGERHGFVPVRRGVFTVYLGSGQQIDASNNPVVPPQEIGSKFDGSDRFVQVQVENDAPLTPLAPIGSVPYALTAGGSVPIGTIVDWFRADLTTAVPDGWAICDGGPVTDPNSPFDGKLTPNLVGRFPRGLNPALLASYGYAPAASAPSLPDLGGQASVDLSHAHNVPHDHGMSHTHDNSHTHAVSGRTGGADQNPPQTPGTPSYDGGPFLHQHNFSATTGAATPSTTGASSALRTTSESPGSTTGLGITQILPPYVGLLKIMRIR